MTKLIGLSGSLRQASYNTALLRNASGLMPDGSELIVETIRGIPLYDADLEAAEGIPEKVTALKDAIAAADGLLLVTPEYNNGVPGVFKNAVDWLSRPTPGLPDVFHDRPVAVIGASPGGFGTIMSQTHWLQVLRTLGTRQWHGGRLMVSRASSVFAPDGALQDDKVRQQLGEFVQGFAAFVAASKA
jgi:chromate reductase